METKCKKCKIGGSGRICGYKNRECSGSNYKYFEPIEEKPMEKKYKVLEEYINEVKEDKPMEKVICDQNKNCNFPCNHRTEHNKNRECGKCAFQERECIPILKKELKQYIIKQKIELLKEVLSHKCSFENIGGQWIGKVVIDDKISELKKEIK